MIKEYSGHLIGLIVAVIFFLLLAYIIDRFKKNRERLKSLKKDPLGSKGIKFKIK